MNRLSKAFSLLLALVTVLAVCGCYERANRPHSGGSGGGEGKTGGGGGGGEKPYGVVIVDVIRPSAEAMASPVCGNVPSSLNDVRAAEMDARVRGITDSLQAQADIMRVVPDEVSLTDCRSFSFSTIETRAVSALPPPRELTDQIRAKLALHVRLVLWYGAGGNSFPSAAVTSAEWGDMASLASLGVSRRLSVNYFAITGPPFGYLWNWKTASDPNASFTAAVVMNPVPSQQGVSELMTAVKKSGAEFSDWLAQRVRGL